MTADNKWQLNRMGFLNFWYYDEEEFYCPDGKLLLRGSNGSGKSVTMQSLIPILLDGRKSPDRLDPFGSRDRKMEDYLLGQKEIIDRDERTGYIYIEYKRKDLDQYITTGIGLRAKRHSSMDFWGFVLQDNRRIGVDFKLYKEEYSAEDGKKVKIPLSRQELSNKIENGGRLVKSQKEYMELVNKCLFGFESIEGYEELIKLLIQLRSPKLSKDFKPTAIYEILNESLPALSDEELTPLSDTIENMDQTKQQIEQLKKDKKSFERICNRYDKYNKVLLADKAEELINTGKTLQKSKKKAEELQDELENEKYKLEEFENNKNELTKEKVSLDEEYNTLKKHEVFDKEEEKNKLESQIAHLNNQIKQKENALEKKQNKEIELKKKIKTENDKVYETEKELEEIIKNLSIEAEASNFTAHRDSENEFWNSYKDSFYFDIWKKDKEEYENELEEILNLFQKENRAKEKYNEAIKELGEAEKELEGLQNERDKWYAFFEDEKQKLLTKIHSWLSENQELKLRDDEKRDLIRNFNNLYEDISYIDAKEPAEIAKRRVSESIQSELLTLKNTIKEKDKEKKNIEEETDEWKNKKDPEPERHPQTIEIRAKLKEKNIPHIPFFAAVEFRKEVPDEIKERIEQAITEMGILDALIIPREQLNQLNIEIKSDKVLKPNPQLLTHTLEDYLYPTPPENSRIKEADITDILRSILIEDLENIKDGVNQPVIDTGGNYLISLISGHACIEDRAIFIGKEARQRYRKQVIAELTEKLGNIIKEIDELKKKENNLNDREEKLKYEYEAFPKDVDSKEAFNTYEEKKREVRTSEKEVDRLNQKMKDNYNNYQQIKDKRRSKTVKMPLDPKEEAYKIASSHMNKYSNLLTELEIKYKDYQSGVQILKQFEENLEEVETDVDEYKGELNTLRDDLKLKNKQLNEVFEELENLGAEEIREKIDYISKRLKEINDVKMIGITRDIEGANNKIEQLSENIKSNEKDLKVNRKLYELWEKVFWSEVSLNLVKVGGLLPPAPEEGTDLLELAGKTVKYFAGFKDDLNLDKTKDSLNQIYHQEYKILMEYRLSMETINESSYTLEDFERDDMNLKEIKENENIQLRLDSLNRKSARINIIMEYGGKKVTPFYVLDEMKKDIEIQEAVLSKEDKRLYEDVILQSVGKTIRSKIYRANKWVERINGLMAERENSSGLKFSIRWKPKTAENEEELDTKDLVEILKKDAKLLKEEDINLVTKHFRSQIERAKEAMAEDQYGETFHQIIKAMLDYRRWFDFTLYYQKAGENRKELTNRVFNTFSGGEKAMAMYIPLFSAAYSRYLEARKDAPHIISLDEAFAGVDEQNIRDMFDLMESLGFNYIINSQSLWGDYDTVKSLSINELIRPQNAPYVTVIRYYWNGKTKQLFRSYEEMTSALDPNMARAGDNIG